MKVIGHIWTGLLLCPCGLLSNQKSRMKDKEKEITKTERQAYYRIQDIINDVERGKWTDTQGIKKIMRAITKQMNRQYKILTSEIKPKASQEKKK